MCAAGVSRGLNKVPKPNHPLSGFSAIHNKLEGC